MNKPKKVVLPVLKVTIEKVSAKKPDATLSFGNLTYIFKKDDLRMLF